MNEKLFLLINSFAGKNHLVDLFFISAAEFLPYLFILVEVYFYFFAKKKNEAIFAFYSAVFGLLINQIISLVYFHNRPFMDGIGTLLINHAPENSFPSDHTTFLFAIAFSLFFSKIKFSYILFVLALLGGVARVYTGVHYPFDILGGIITGFLGALITYIFRDKLFILNDIILETENTLRSKFARNS
ncbi:undecaprenyl-diphosphate phosphatase BcrC [Caminibacter profundus]